jgi:cytochrome c oxidase subunit 2
MNAMQMWQASREAAEIDWLFIALCGMSLAVLALVFGLIWVYAIRYRASNPLHRGHLLQKTWRFETAWTVATLLFFFVLFGWGAVIFVRLNRPPQDAMKIWVVGKQWMWKIEYPGGQREINALHVPIGRPVELVMTSEDVIHDFGLPAFRLKRDVLPGRYQSLWFVATRIGRYHLFCDQFCGTDHALMTGEVDVLSGPDYQRWLDANPASESLAAAGQDLFVRYGCAGCHFGSSVVRAPRLEGLYGSPVPLADGRIITADDRYIHDKILEPNAELPAGYAADMPSFAGQVSEEDLVKLVAYVKSLATAQREGPQG